MSKPELMIAAWPANPINMNDHSYGDETVAYKVYLRNINPDDKWSLNEDERAANDLGLYVWAHIDGTVSIDVRAMEIHSANVKELEARVKLLKVLARKAERAGFDFHSFKRDASVYEELVKCIDAIGIRRAVQYHGISQPETFVNVSIAIKRIADAFDAQLERMRQRKQRSAA